jgi:glyoxylase-like metal-dependent hydrolase (beta-lactamase superfamily II)
VIQDDYSLISPEVPQDATEILSAGPYHADCITDIVFSHLHFDHTGDCTRFPQARLTVGPGSKAATTPGYPHKLLSPFASSILEHSGFHELDFEKDTWISVGPFPRAHDFFGDGSFYLLDTPGHMPGHLAGLAQTDPGEWVFMGGDCCHHRALLVGTRPVSVTVGPNGTPSFHRDPKAAIKTIGLIRELEEYEHVFVALAHDAMLVDRMPLYPSPVNGWKGSLWKKGIDDDVNHEYRN